MAIFPPNLRKTINPQTQKAQQIPMRISTQKTTLRHNHHQAAANEREILNCI